jgi:YHS domain-containing protein
VSEVACAVCGVAFEEEGAVDMGASFLDLKGKRFWFCCPPCEAEFRAAPGKYGG